jgi:hypothetical protein
VVFFILETTPKTELTALPSISVEDKNGNIGLVQVVLYNSESITSISVKVRGTEIRAVLKAWHELTKLFRNLQPSPDKKDYMNTEYSISLCRHQAVLRTNISHAPALSDYPAAHIASLCSMALPARHLQDYVEETAESRGTKPHPGPARRIPFSHGALLSAVLPRGISDLH